MKVPRPAVGSLPIGTQVQRERRLRARLSEGNFCEHSPGHLPAFRTQNPTELGASGAALSEYILSSKSY